MWIRCSPDENVIVILLKKESLNQRCPENSSVSLQFSKFLFLFCVGMKTNLSNISLFYADWVFLCFFHLGGSPFSLHTYLQSNTEACSPFSLCVLGGGSGLHFNMTLWISPPRCAAASVSLWFHSTHWNPGHLHRKALVLFSGLWLVLTVNPWRWPVSVCVAMGHQLLKLGPNVSL